MSEWQQPIETAPKEQGILAWEPVNRRRDGCCLVLYWADGDVDPDVKPGWYDGERKAKPTHWMLLPEPPNA